MQYKLINEIDENNSVIETLLINRKIPKAEIAHYLNPTDEDINDFLLLGKEKLEAAASALVQCVQNNKKILIVVDSDCDGYCSAAILLNYLYLIFPTFVINNIAWIHHEGKQHGLNDCIEEALKYDMVICPDSASNDIQEAKLLSEKSIPLICLDHHLVEQNNPYAIVINNQNCDYPNKSFCGGGVTWQFCRYLDSLLGTNHANNFLDLVALSLCGDMMSRCEIETKYLMDKGFQSQNIKNPFFFYMVEKNSYSLGDTVTPIGAAFYIVPFINAITRSGTQEEKELIFKSMLTFEAFKEVPSTKRGHTLGEMEKIVEQAVRTCTNVKNRQTRSQEEGLNHLESIIEKDNLLEHKVLLLLLEPDVMQPEIKGLVANKFMAKYQRPCCILTKSIDKDTGQISYQGSSRGYSKSGCDDFKSICEATNCIDFTAGHPNAFGLGIKQENIENFIEQTDYLLRDIRSEPSYYVDFIYSANEEIEEDILAIAELKNIWGQDLDEPLICIENVTVTPDMVTIYQKKNNTLKIKLPNGIEIMKFNVTEEECELFESPEYKIVNIIGECNKNEWCGNVKGQIFMKDYDIVRILKYYY